MDRARAIMLFLIFATYSVQGLRINSLQQSTNVPNDILEAFSLVSNAYMDLDREIEMEQMMNAMQVVAKHFNAKPFVVVTEQRSGSNWLVSLLNSHPEIKCFEEYFAHHKGTLREAFEDMSAKVKNKPRLKRMGFKLMISQFRKVEDLWNERQSMESAPTFIMHWRRNVLRRMISHEANNYDKYHPGPSGHKAHAVTAAEAQRLANYKPKIDVRNLEHNIDKELNKRRAVANEINKYGLPTCPDSHYEEWLTHPDEAKESFLNCLQVAPDALHSDKLSLHAHTEILKTVANPTEIRKALEHSKYAYMLEDGATDEQINENLKKSDTL